MEKQIAARSTSGDEEQSRDVARQSPMRPENPVHPPSWEYNAESIPPSPMLPDRTAFTPPPPHHSSETPEPPPPRLRRGSRRDYQLTRHTARDAGSPLTQLEDDEDDDSHAGAVPPGSPAHTHRKGKIPRRGPTSSNMEPAKKKGKQSRK